MAQTTFAVDEHTAEIISQLKSVFGVKTNAQVIRKALALARAASENAGQDKSIVIKSPDGEEKHILLAG